MNEQNIPEYEVIRAAVAGEQWAVEKVLECYSGEIDRLATVEKRQPDGSVQYVVDEDLRQRLITKLIAEIPHFQLEESGE